MSFPALHQELKQKYRQCRQCFVTKPLICYLSKSHTNLCVICDRCRSAQRKRYYCRYYYRFNKLVNRSKKMQSTLYKSSRYIALREFSTNLVSLPCHLEKELCCESTQNNHLFPVPYSKWITVCPFSNSPDCLEEIPLASLVHYSYSKILVKDIVESKSKQVMSQDVSPCYVKEEL